MITCMCSKIQVKQNTAKIVDNFLQMFSSVNVCSVLLDVCLLLLVLRFFMLCSVVKIWILCSWWSCDQTEDWKAYYFMIWLLNLLWCEENWEIKSSFKTQESKKCYRITFNHLNALNSTFISHVRCVDEFF